MTDYSKNAPEELQKQLADKREELRAMRFSAAGSRSRNTKSGSILRKDIARILTALNAPKVAKIEKAK